MVSLTGIFPDINICLRSLPFDLRSVRSKTVNKILDIGVPVAVKVTGSIRRIFGIKTVFRFPFVRHTIHIGIFVRDSFILRIPPDQTDVCDYPLQIRVSAQTPVFELVQGVGIDLRRSGDPAGPDLFDNAFIHGVAPGERSSGVGQYGLISVLRRLDIDIRMRIRLILSDQRKHDFGIVSVFFIDLYTTGPVVLCHSRIAFH